MFIEAAPFFHLGLYSLVFSLFETFIFAFVYYQRRRVIVAWNKFRDATGERVLFSKLRWVGSRLVFYIFNVYLVTPFVARNDCKTCQGIATNYVHLFV